MNEGAHLVPSFWFGKATKPGPKVRKTYRIVAREDEVCVICGETFPAEEMHVADHDDWGDPIYVCVNPHPLEAERAGLDVDVWAALLDETYLED